ncbi:uncharacterized protein LOC118548377 isoform X3 [Halichoerus grypus]|uniref:uncharacterized protein LOC118548377 isoform X3 n=1 Tax=Halichoerus grypus TaxID=9711 RepID=UPI001659FF19|nr:uncharacterized protein LOC118548377 isoform X3 [Halichoerus grypus]
MCSRPLSPRPVCICTGSVWDRGVCVYTDDSSERIHKKMHQTLKTVLQTSPPGVTPWTSCPYHKTQVPRLAFSSCFLPTLVFTAPVRFWFLRSTDAALQVDTDLFPAKSKGICTRTGVFAFQTDAGVFHFGISFDTRGPFTQSSPFSRPGWEVVSCPEKSYLVIRLDLEEIEGACFWARPIWISGSHIILTGATHGQGGR